MEFTLFADRLALTVFAGLLVWAAWSDLRDFLIPNRICLAIAMLFPAHVAATGALEVVPARSPPPRPPSRRASPFLPSALPAAGTSS